MLEVIVFEDLLKLFLVNLRVCKSLIPDGIYLGFLKDEVRILIVKIHEFNL